jgi:hypothetical protein
MRNICWALPPLLAGSEVGGKNGLCGEATAETLACGLARSDG